MSLQASTQLWRASCDVDKPRGACHRTNWPVHSGDRLPLPPGRSWGKESQVILSFDVEEHHRIEAAAGLNVDPALKAHYDGRVAPPTYWLLDQLARHDIRATFFVLGPIARRDPGLIRAIHRAGHEVASHGWDHRRVHVMTPASFREDVRRSVDALEQVTGEAVVGYRAPTFSVVRQTSWAIDVLSELGLLYDSSIYPVHHDRYGVPDAPRVPFLVRGQRQRDPRDCRRPPCASPVPTSPPAAAATSACCHCSPWSRRSGRCSGPAGPPWRCCTSTRGNSTRVSPACLCDA